MLLGCNCLSLLRFGKILSTRHDPVPCRAGRQCWRIRGEVLQQQHTTNTDPAFDNATNDSTNKHPADTDPETNQATPNQQNTNSIEEHNGSNARKNRTATRPQNREGVRREHGQREGKAALRSERACELGFHRERERARRLVNLHAGNRHREEHTG
jgi:hypothetical protein